MLLISVRSGYVCSVLTDIHVWPIKIYCGIFLSLSYFGFRHRRSLIFLIAK